MSINTEMTALADAIRAKSGTTGKLSIAGMTTAVNSIVITPGEGDVDLSVVTVTAADILKGKVAVGADGNQITGEIETVEASSDGTKVTVPAGFHAASAEFDISAGTTVDLSFVTATASDILAGKVGADKDGNPVNGTIQTVAASLTDNVVTVPAGYHEEQTLTVTEAAAPTVSENVVTVPKGYNTATKEVTVGTAKAAETITPGTANQTVPAGTYLSGDLTVKGDANLLPENIAEGVFIFGVEGALTAEDADVEFGYINADGRFQSVILSEDPPGQGSLEESVDLYTYDLPVDVEPRIRMSYGVDKSTDSFYSEYDYRGQLSTDANGNLVVILSAQLPICFERSEYWGTEYLIWNPEDKCYVIAKEVDGVPVIKYKLYGRTDVLKLDGTYTSLDGSQQITLLPIYTEEM